MSDKYRINPDYIVPEPTAADHFAFFTLDEYSHEAVTAVLKGWRDDGVKQSRITIVNDEYPNEPYPHGYWLEGWTAENARMLPFGEAEEPGGAIYPPLVSDTGKLHAEVTS